MTNLEYIRTLEAEELAAAIKDVDGCEETCAYKGKADCGAKCHDGFVEWLKQARKPELKPCPFCGGEAQMSYTTEGAWAMVTWVCCSDCTAKVRGYNKAEAIEAWKESHRGSTRKDRSDMARSKGGRGPCMSVE